jgi:DNA repair exonuclease SbcCD nuclease subunit
VKAQLLCVGDLHLGRRPTHLPPEEAGLAARELGPEAAWRSCVKSAIAEEVDAVLLAGDVVERMEDRFAAWNALYEGVAELTGAGIPVIGVAGNHDVEALPRLAERLEAFRMLGRGGRWESFDLEVGGKPAFRIWGWSFSERHHSRSPLEGFQMKRARGLVELGLLHCDLDQKVSRYGPVSRKELAATGLGGWLLGHVHQPSLAGTPPIGYLGAVTGFDPSDLGPRGPWMLTLSAEGKLAAEQRALQPLRYEQIELDASELEAEDAAGWEDVLHGLLFSEGLEKTAERLAPELEAAGGATRAVSVRVKLTGQSASRGKLSSALRRIEARAGGLPRTRTGSALVYLDQVDDEVLAARDLELLARDTSYPGLLAKRILSLESMDAEGKRLVERVGDDVPRRLGANRGWIGVEREAWGEDERREVLLSAAHEALERVLAQGEEQDGGF